MEICDFCHQYHGTALRTVKIESNRDNLQTLRLCKKCKNIFEERILSLVSELTPVEVLQ